MIRLPGKKGKFQPDNDFENNFWFFVEPLKMSEFTKLKLRSTFYLEAPDDGPNGYPLGNQTRIYIRNNHLQYAITWFLIAVGLVGVYLAANIRKNKVEMKYYSTRGGESSINFEKVVLKGLATDGGLYIPEKFPNFNHKDFSNFRELEYSELAYKITKDFIGKSIPLKDYQKCHNTYSNFSSKRNN